MDATLQDPLVGRLLEDRYRVQARIAVGGMATVYRAVDTRLDRVLALKVMHPALAADAAFVDRFILEAKAVARLDHPNVVGVFDQGVDGSYVFLAMEYVAGCTLRDLLRERGALHPRAALDILEPVLAALGSAHRADLLHRDVKPENVLIGDDGRVKVADFGLVRSVGSHTSTTSGSVLGTLSYMAPEQIEHGVTGHRSDVYSCGVLLYEMLTGSKPYTGSTPAQIVRQHLEHDVPAPSLLAPGVAGELDALVARATARDPRQRPADAVELLALLQEARRGLTDEQLDAVPPQQHASSGSGDGESGSSNGGSGSGEERTTVLPSVHSTVPLAAAVGSDTVRESPGDGTERTARMRIRPVDPSDDGGRVPVPAPGGAVGRAVRRRPWAALVALLLVLGAGAGVWYVGEGQFTRTPALLGLSRAEAERRIADAGLDAEYSAAFHETVEEGKVVSTDPAPGSRIRGNGTVSVVVSKGPERIAVPDVAGMSPADARAAVERAGLGAGTTEHAFSDVVDRGDVVSTDPAVGRRVAPDTAVSFVVSKGAAVRVPDLVGLSPGKARKKLADAGLKARTAPEGVFSDEVREGDVAEQSVRADSTVAEGTAVELTLSKGQETFEVPDVEGKDLEKAKKELEKAGFSVSVIDFPLGRDKVFNQTPEAGSRHPADTTVTLWVR
ncbi:Stk1 family PASTA domain-containing Ser/Thr kinase [Streptomyces sp. SCUT-3]|uniref:Stk1 family PASTA domain-containing Ser/Thr kinase n=1 Tax=Streptomyces sp. SCUT-3 TaxID=2684469 RepID=UPI0015FDC308|nr:Stk1 family PASTA domain-containing Ser/Thr kinase [Streptomyces sp. SCUT-3]QMV23796.1 Stk1 family PASTA domain-containing Ser/Thr kinase [Streptomyces sp. SCUT-3]